MFNHAKNGIANNTIDQAKALAGVKLGGNADGTLTSTKVLEQEWVGYGDAVDYQKLVFQHAGSYTFTTSGLSGKVKLTVYSVDANGKQKSLKSITVNSGTGTIKDLLLEANTNYYIAVESTDAKKGASIDYEVSVGGKVFNHDKNGLANNSFDQARALPVLTVTGNADGTLGSTPVLADEWVGYGDAADWQKLTFTDAGSYTFTVSGLSQKAKLTVYSVDANGKLKSMKSITVNAPKSGVASGTIKDLLMLAGTTYYIAVEAPDWKKGVGTDYELNVSGNVFNHAKNNLANNSYDQVRGQSVTPITGNADGTLSTTPLLADEWVGYGDSVSGVSQKVKLTVYGVDAKGNLKSLKSITVNAPKSGVASGTIQNLLMDAGSYYVAVEATDWKKGVGTDYNVSMSGSVYNNAKNGLNNGSWNAAGVETLTLSTGKAVSGEWVGYGDASDYFAFKVGADGSAAGQYTFKLTSADGNNLNGNATFTIYQKKYNSKGAASVSKVGSFTNNKADSITLELGEGEYFMAVDSADKGKGKKNMGYDIDVTAPAAPSLTSFAQDQQPAPAAAFADLAGFDGVTAALNAVAADTLAGFGSALDSLSGGDEQKKSPLFSVL